MHTYKLLSKQACKHFPEGMGLIIPELLGLALGNENSGNGGVIRSPEPQEEIYKTNHRHEINKY